LNLFLLLQFLSILGSHHLLLVLLEVLHHHKLLRPALYHLSKFFSDLFGVVSLVLLSALVLDTGLAQLLVSDIFLCLLVGLEVELLLALEQLPARLNALESPPHIFGHYVHLSSQLRLAFVEHQVVLLSLILLKGESGIETL
jgi:hypothetical protein